MVYVHQLEKKMNLLSALIDMWIGKAFLGCLAWLFRK